MNVEPQQREVNDSENRPIRRAYVKPHIQRVDLALEETLTTGCKSYEDCELELDPTDGS